MTMQDEQNTQATPATPPSAEQTTVAQVPEASERNDRRGRGGKGARGARGKRSGEPRERKEFDQATIDVRRVARVMAGGRRFSFSVAVVIGDRKGRVGVGLGKATDTALAIDKATRDARKHLITIPLTGNGSIAHDVTAKYASSTVTIIPSPGRGLVAGSSTRTVLEYAGVTDIVSKIMSRTKNKLSIARATVVALKKLKKK